MIETTYKPKDIISEITRTLKIFKSDTTLKEIRTFGNKIYSGYFTDTDKLTKAINEYKDITWYFIMNNIDADCYNREQRDCITYSKTTTSDSDITNREWLLIDCDPIRKSGMSASDDEKQHALNTLSAVYDFLQSRGFYEPVIADSGNGYHLLYQIDTPNTKENTDTIKSFLSLLDMRFTDEYVKIDTAVFNPARITKLYGTYARKGANTPDRPHRQSHIMSVPNQIAVTDISLIQSVADMLPKPEKPTYNGKSDSKFDIRDFIHKHGIAVQPDRVCSDKTIIRLEKCPFNPEHKAADSALFLYNDGALGFKCFHDSCSHNHWKEFRKHYEPEAYEKSKHHVTISDETPIDIESLSTWEQLTDVETLTELLSCKDEIQLAQNKAQLLDKVRQLKRINDFKAIMKAVDSKISAESQALYMENNPNGLHFTDSPIQLSTDKYRGKNSGVYLYEDCIIPQPLLITKLFEDVESGDVKAEIAFRDKGVWKYHTVLRGVIANRNKIIDLANVGLAVTTDNANEIVNYLQELQTVNAIPTQKSAPSLGYHDNQFIPYSTKIVYTAVNGSSYTKIHNSIHSNGNHDTWVNLYREVRNDSFPVRIIIASSFASVLLEPLDLPLFITHIEGDSDTGKSVCLKFACSPWGKPEQYIHNLNGTTNGLERLAEFYHNFPLILDESQTVQNDDLISKLIYMVTQGEGKMRAVPYGLAHTPTWHCGFITSGEKQLTRENSATGEFNRIINLHVEDKVFNDPTHVYTVCNENYGHAGRYFIEHIEKYETKSILKKWQTILNRDNKNLSGKHFMELSAILMIDDIINQMFLNMDEQEAHDDTLMLMNQLASNISSKADTDMTTRGYEFICGFIAENINKFNGQDPFLQWGHISGGGTTVEISNKIFMETVTKAGYSYKSLLQGLAKRNKLIKGNDGGNTKNTKMNGVQIRVVELILPTEYNDIHDATEV